MTTGVGNLFFASKRCLSFQSNQVKASRPQNNGFLRLKFFRRAEVEMS